MRAFLDTSVLVAVFYGDHQHHEPSIGLFLRLNRATGCFAAHSLAEVYATLTGMPGKELVSGDEALLFLGDVRDRLTAIALDAEEFAEAIDSAAAAGVAGGGIYDALIGRCALKARASNLYTWNVRDFQRLGDPVARRVRTP